MRTERLRRYGSCERVYYSQIDTRLFTETCVCDVGWSGATCNMRDPACFTMNDGNGTWVTGSWGVVVPPHRGHKMPFAPKARIPRALNQERKHETLNAAASARVKM